MSCTTQRKQIDANNGHLFKEIWEILAEHWNIKPHKTGSNSQMERRQKREKSRLACCSHKSPVCRSHRTLKATALLQSATFLPATTIVYLPYGSLWKYRRRKEDTNSQHSCDTLSYPQGANAKKGYETPLAMTCWCTDEEERMKCARMSWIVPKKSLLVLVHSVVLFLFLMQKSYN